jgi:hypothetical protein
MKIIFMTVLIMFVLQELAGMENIWIVEVRVVMTVLVSVSIVSVVLQVSVGLVRTVIF